MAHINLHELHQAGDQKYKRENNQSEEGVAGYLADDITIQNAHDCESSVYHAVSFARFSLCVTAAIEGIKH